MNRSFVRSAARAMMLATSLTTAALAQPAPPATPAAPEPARVVLPLQRTAYFVGERVPFAATGVAADQAVLIEATGPDGPVTLYKGKPAPLMLDTSRLAPGEYALSVNGVGVGQRLFIVSPLSKSSGSMQDEAPPPEPRLDGQKQYAPGEVEALAKAHWPTFPRWNWQFDRTDMRLRP
ncbi:MAG: hypothetical protein NTW19_07440 [Planctomycetota bacterium]|nr:hypothetical protein [Planctomycetota bacterium]